MPIYDPQTALLVVDVQNDFADPSGSLYVRGGEQVIPLINVESTRARAAGAPVFYTQDWHPEATPHFQKDGGVWPVHCVRDSWGAEFHPDLLVDGPVVRKGSNGEDGYSAFSMRDPLSGETVPTELAGLLAEASVTRLVVCGLATDYCVQATALEARGHGYPTTVLEDAIRAVDLQGGDGDRAVEAMLAAGARLESRGAGRHPPDGVPTTRPAGTAIAQRFGLDSAVMEAATDARPYSPGLEKVLAGETSIARVDGENGRLTYRGFPIGELVQQGTYEQVAELLWSGEWPEKARLTCAPLSAPVLATLRSLPDGTNAMDALRSAISAYGATERLGWPPTPEQARALTAIAPSALAAFARLQQGLEVVEPDPGLQLAAGFLYQLNGEAPDEASARALDAYFVVAAEHGFNASTFTARVITSTQADLASAVCGAIGALKGPLHGGAPSEVVNQLHEIGSPDRAEGWIRDALQRGERLMGFGHRVYRAYDPRAAALRTVAEGMASTAEWLRLAVAVEDIALRLLAERHPDRPLQTNVEYYTAAVLQGIGLPPALFPATFALARNAGWTAHCIEQASANRLIRPDVRYIGEAERSLPAAATA